MLQLLAGSDFYANLGITALELGTAVVGGLAGLGVGIPLRATASRRAPTKRSSSASKRSSN